MDEEDGYSPASPALGSAGIEEDNYEDYVNGPVLPDYDEDLDEAFTGPMNYGPENYYYYGHQYYDNDEYDDNEENENGEPSQTGSRHTQL